VIDYFKTTKMNAFGWLLVLDDKGNHIELGRRQPQYLKAVATASDGKEKVSRLHDQITIRTVRLPIKLRNRGILSLLVKWILETTGGVQLEAVEDGFLLKRVSTSPLWTCQSPHNNGKPGSSYSRVAFTKPFQLF
jgi:hypothetical protein